MGEVQYGHPHQIDIMIKEAMEGESETSTNLTVQTVRLFRPGTQRLIT